MYPHLQRSYVLVTNRYDFFPHNTDWKGQLTTIGLLGTIRISLATFIFVNVSTFLKKRGALVGEERYCHVPFFQASLVISIEQEHQWNWVVRCRSFTVLALSGFYHSWSCNWGGIQKTTFEQHALFTRLGDALLLKWSVHYKVAFCNYTTPPKNTCEISIKMLLMLPLECYSKIFIWTLSHNFEIRGGIATKS
jgi:hypothetical protein